MSCLSVIVRFRLARDAARLDDGFAIVGSAHVLKLADEVAEFRDGRTTSEPLANVAGRLASLFSRVVHRLYRGTLITSNKQVRMRCRIPRRSR